MSLGTLDLFPPPPPLYPRTSSYLLLFLPPTLLLWYGLVWAFNLYVDVGKLGWVGNLDYNSSGPFLSYEIEIGDGPGPKLDNNCLQNLI